MMHALTRLVRLWCVLVVVSTFLSSPALAAGEGASAWELDLLLMACDTTKVPCDNATNAYSSWINTLRLQIQAPAEAMGDSVSIVPTPPTSYLFDGPCGDTITLEFRIFDDMGNPKSNNCYSFLAFDNEPPEFNTPLGDTILLTCFEAVPPASNVTITDCRLDETSFEETVQDIGNCPLEQRIIRRWTATDRCGQMSNFTQVILIEDDEAPTFINFPADTLVDCNSPTDTMTMGSPMARDLCDSDPEIGFFDQVNNNGESTCANRYTILRNWTVMDNCGNTRTKIQRIVVRDDTPPTFSEPADTVISCAFGDDPFFTGRPSNVSDNCDILGPDNIRFEDLILSDSCDNIYTVQRTWFVSDNCGNTATSTQRIEVVDEGGLVFDTPAQDLILECTSDLDAQSAYSNWLDDRAGAEATDNCTPPEELTYQVLDSATGQSAVFPVQTCFDGNTYIYEQTVYVIVSDDCGQRDTSIARFRVIDDQKPVISNCLPDTIISTDPGRCDAQFILPEPLFTEECTAPIRYQFKVGDNPRVNVSHIGPVAVRVPQGATLVTQYLIDCAGNIDSCSFYVTVQDREAPVVICPADESGTLDPGTCQALLPLTYPVSITDNCTLDSLGNAPRVDYFISGATTTDPASFEADGMPPTIAFELGISTVHLIARDQTGSADTCSYQVTIRDEESPTVRCQPTTLFVNPSGLVDEEVGVQAVNAGSFDNCSLDTLFLEPFTFSCDLAGTVQDVVLTGVDGSGNTAQCSTIVRVENLRPQPTASSGLCGSDTLYLVANAPPADGGVVYQYNWTGPNGFTSNLENPVIPNIGPANAGSYVVQVTGITGCTATGTVEVSIEDLPLTPNLVAEQHYCVDENIVLESSVQPETGEVVYRWYTGTAPNGTLFAETQIPILTLQAPHSAGQRTFYVEVEADGCASPPSASRTFTINSIPTAIPDTRNISICAGEAIMLGTPITGPGITYEWTGPNGFTSTSQYPLAIDPATTLNDGVYVLTVSRNGCASPPAYVNVDVLPRPGRPELSNNGPACAGEDIVLSTNADAEVYTWIAPDLREFSTTSDTFLIDNALAADGGSWRLYVTDFSCDSETSLPTSVQVSALPQPAAAAVPDVICEGSTMTLTASPDIPNATYRWTGPNNYVAVGKSVNIENMGPNKEGTYSLRITNQAGCSNTDDIAISVEESVRVIAASNNGPECLPGPTDILLTSTVFPEDDGTLNYRWTGPNGFVSTDATAIIPNATEEDNGNYQLQVVTQEGCRSNVVGTLVDVADPPAMPSVPAISTGTPEPLCEGNDITLVTTAYEGTNVVYSWRTSVDGIVQTETPSLTIPRAEMADGGMYSVFVTVDGCPSRESGQRRLVINDKPSATISSNSPVCEGLPIELRAVAPADSRYLWAGPDFSSSLANPVIAVADSASHAGVYSLVIEVNGCRSDSVKTQVEILDAPMRPDLEQAPDLCVDDPGAFLRLRLADTTETPGATYTWYGPNGVMGSGTQSTFGIRDFEPFPDGLNSFYVTATLNACTSEESNLIDVDLNKVPDVQAFAGQDFSACETDNILLRGETPDVGTGRWTLLGPDTASQVVITNPNRANSALNGLSGGTNYTFRWTLSNGACQNYSFDDVTIDVNVTETADAGDDIVACASRDITLSATPSISGNAFWSQTNVQELLGVSIINPTSATPSITGMQPGNLYSFTWTVRSGCGDVTDEVLVLISDPNPFAGPDQIVCNDENFAQLMADEPTEGSRGRWYSPNPDIRFSSGESPTTTATRLSPGLNIFIWEIDDGICGIDSRDTVRVQYKRNPIAQPDMAMIGFGEEIVLDVVNNDSLIQDVFLEIVGEPDHGTVEILSDREIRYVPDVNYVGSDRFFYELCSQGCACSLAEVQLEVGGNAACEVPSIITPNNDGVNDVFAIPCLLNDTDYPNSQLFIINQWGDEVYRSGVPYTNDWQGQYNGEDLAPGTYFYILDFGDGSPRQNGFFMIQR
jgi:gliding motility-associated-like protein